MITVSRSCLYNCSFCTIPKGRGEYSSISISTIKDKISTAMSKGIFRIILIGDEVGNYGIDLKNGTSFKTLVDEILSMDKRIKIAIRYIEPTPFYKNFETIKNYCIEDRIYLLHIPLQTGSQDLLMQMNRNHNLEKIIPFYKLLIDNTNTTFYCNWMIGFPGETEKDFQHTLDLAKTLQIQLNTVIPFSARPDTKAYERNDFIPDEIIQQRCERLEEVLLQLKLDHFRSIAQNLTIHEKEKMIRLIADAEFTKLKQLNG